MNDSLSNLNGVLSSLNEDFEEIRIYNSTSKDNLLALSKASITKCFEFLLASTNEKLKYPYLILGTLRGICEEIITITYLINYYSEGDLKSLIEFDTKYEQGRALIKQFEFFEKYKSGQLIVHPKLFLSDVEIDEIKSNISATKMKQLAKFKGCKVLPSVREMATQLNYDDLYEYIYYITSASVHYRFDNLMKMGWGNIENNEIKEVHFSIENTKNYYQEFSISYGLLLFVEMGKKFNQKINFSESFWNKINQIENIIKTKKYPPMIEHFHVNISEFAMMMNTIANKEEK